MPTRLILALDDLAAAVGRLETAAAQAKAAEAARLDDVLAANADVGTRLAETASALRALSAEAAPRPGGSDEPDG